MLDFTDSFAMMSLTFEALKPLFWNALFTSE